MPTFILTLRLDEEAQAFFQNLRELHFPPERNLIPAHVTLFHQLPADDAVRITLEQVAEREECFSLEVSGLFSLGRGVAYSLSSPRLMALRNQLADAFAHFLIVQDKQKFRPHVVIQNKVSPAQAQILLQQQRQKTYPATARACGLDLWEYLGGPWEHQQHFPFGGECAESRNG